MESTITSVGSTILTEDDVGKATLDEYSAELLLDPTVPSELHDEEDTPPEDVALTLLQDLDKFSPTSELFAEVDESSPQAIKSTTKNFGKVKLCKFCKQL